MDVDILVHSPTNVWLVTLEEWLNPGTNQQAVKFEWNTVQTGKRIPCQRDPTIQKFMRETTLDPTVAGKRPRVDLASPSGVSPKKAGHVQGWRKPVTTSSETLLLDVGTIEIKHMQRKGHYY